MKIQLMKMFVALVAAQCLLSAGANTGAMPLDANAELASAYRCDLPGPEVWTVTPGGRAFDGTAESYLNAEVPSRRFGAPAPGMSGILYVVHLIPDLKNPVVLEVREGDAEISFVPVRNHWTPAFMTTYYRSLPNATSPADEKRIGRIVLKERKAILSDNTFLAETTVKNTSSLPLKCRVSVKTNGGLPGPGEPAKVWRFTTKLKGRNTERVTCAASGASFGTDSVSLELPPHGERTFRYALAFSPSTPADASARVSRALADADAFAANARAFNDWFTHNVPRLETGNPDLLKMYLYRWFVVKRGTHEARRAIPDHEYPRRAVYESPVSTWTVCVVGLPVPVQIQEIAWGRDPGVLRDHILNWCDKVRGYRDYIQYTGQAIALALENHPSKEFARQILPAVAQFARDSAGSDPAKLPVQNGSWMTGAEYQPNFYQFTEPKWNFHHDYEFSRRDGVPMAKLVRLDTAIYAIGNLLGAAKLAEAAGDASTAAELRKFAASHLEIVKTRHWDENTGLFLAADPATYRLADEAACYDSFAPYMWGLLCEDKYLCAFDKLLDRAWFWDDFPVSTCAKNCPMYCGANAIYVPPASIAAPHYYGCSWNGPMWHYANSLIAEAFGQGALRRKEMRGKWVEFFDAWSESHFAYGDRTALRAGEHYRPEDGAYCGTEWDYFHSSWLAPFFRYRCGIRPAKDGKSIVFEPFTDEDFRVSDVPVLGREFTFEQRSGRLEVRDAAGTALASGEGSVSFAVAAGTVDLSASADAKAAQGADFNVRDFGGSVAKAAEAAAQAGGGRIVVPPGVWKSGTIWLKDHCELHLEKGATILGSEKEADYNANDVFPENFHDVGEEWSGGHLILAYKATDVAITGEGVIDGSGPAFFGETEFEWGFPFYKYGIKLHPTDREWFRPGPMVAMFLSKNIRLEGVTLKNTPCWTAHFRCCDGLDIRGVTIDADREIANSDGFSIDCTKNVVVKDCVVKTGDDGFAIRASCKFHAAEHPCEHIRIENCDVWSCCFGVRFGVGTGTIRDVSVDNCRFHESAIGLSFTPAWINEGKNVYIENIRVRNCVSLESERPVWVSMPRGDARVADVLFENCRFEALQTTTICGTEQSRPDNIVFRNCTYRQIPRVRVRQGYKWLQDHKKRCREFYEARGPVGKIEIVNCDPPPLGERGMLLLSFDDRNFADWEAALPIFAKYGAHATFFVSGSIDQPTVRSLKRLSADGHSIGLHGLNHLNADEAIAAHGADRYFADDVWPQKDAASKSYVPFESFAYPNCRFSDESDELLRKKGFARVRGGVKGATPYDPDGKKQADRKPLVSNEAVFFPVADLPKHFRIDTIIVGEAYHTDIEEICACIRRAAERKEVLSITSHGISPDAKGINMKTEWLERILATAKESGLAVIGFDELP